jgi:hypothetical protein
LSKLPSGTPPHIRTLLERCLDKAPRTRLRDIGEARIALARGTALDARAAPSRGLPLALVIAIALGAAAAGSAIASRRGAAAARPGNPLEGATILKLIDWPGDEFDVAISPPYLCMTVGVRITPPAPASCARARSSSPPPS